MVVLESCRPQHGDLGSQLSDYQGCPQVDRTRVEGQPVTRPDLIGCWSMSPTIDRQSSGLLLLFAFGFTDGFGWAGSWLQIYNHTQKNPQITVQCTTSNRTTTTTIATILILPVANCCTYSTRKLPKWWARVSDSRKGWGWWVVFLFQREWW